MAAGGPVSAMVLGFVSLTMTRVLTFVLNLYVARKVLPEDYGVGTVQFHLVTTVILTLSREGFRRGCLRVPANEDKELTAARVLVLSALVWPVGVLVTAATCLVPLAASNAHADETYRHALLLLGCSCFLELLAEPLYVLASVQLRFRWRACVDAATGVARTLTLAALLRAGAPPAPAFAKSQLAASAAFALGYLPLALSAASMGTSVVRRWDSHDRSTLRVVALFTLQAGEKLVLGEGVRLCLAWQCSARVAGEYALVDNLGSMLPRVLFAQVEEMAFAAFSRAGTQASDSTSRGKLWRALVLLTRTMAAVGMLACVFGPPFAHAALFVLYGRRWSDTGAPLLLAAYCPYLMLLAVNGVTEAFVHAVLGAAALSDSNAALLLLSVAHGALLAVCAPAGALALLAANAASMALRVAYSLRCIQHYFAGALSVKLRELMLSPASLGLCVIVAAVLNAGNSYAMHFAQQPYYLKIVLVQCCAGLLMFMMLLAGLYHTEHASVQYFASLRRPRMHQTDKSD